MERLKTETLHVTLDCEEQVRLKTETLTLDCVEQVRGGAGHFP